MDPIYVCEVHCVSSSSSFSLIPGCSLNVELVMFGLVGRWRIPGILLSVLPGSLGWGVGVGSQVHMKPHLDHYTGTGNQAQVLVMYQRLFTTDSSFQLPKSIWTHYYILLSILRVHICIPQHMNRGQRTTCRSQFSPLPCGTWRLNSDHRAKWQQPLWVEPYQQSLWNHCTGAVMPGFLMNCFIPLEK